jgi:Zn-dependent protease/predicted transcriptional regulator
MKWSWKVGRIAGIDVYIHSTFFLLLLWVGFINLGSDRDVGAALSAVGFVVAIFACVLLHEFGHALMAKRLGFQTRDITLLPIGGLARLERIPRDPMQELWVALAGPAVNVVIAAVLLVWLLATSEWQPISGLGVASGSFVWRVLWVNVILVAFNALPAFPMDGGRVLRAILATQMDHTRATQIAATVGQGMALLFGLVGLFANPLLIFIALFVWIGAAQEASLVQMQEALGGIPVRRAMLTEYVAVGPGDSLGRLIELTLAGSQRDFPVTEDGRVIGIVTQDALLRGLTERGRDVPASEVMRTDFQTAEANEMLEAALSRCNEAGDCTVLPVTDHGRLVGLVTGENVGEFIRIQSALAAAARANGRRRRAPAGAPS